MPTKLQTLGLMFLAASLSACGGGSGSPGNGGGGGGGGGTPNPIPTIALLEPPAAATGGPDFYLSVYGSNFVPTSTVEWNGATLTTTFVNSKMIYAQVSASRRAAPGNISLLVRNPSPGGGSSNSISFKVDTPAPPPEGIGVLQLVSAAPDGSPANDDAFTNPTISPDGRYIGFQSLATNLVPGPASGFAEVFIRDTCIDAPAGCVRNTTRVSVASDGSLPNAHSRGSAVSANGRYVAFDSSATNMYPGVDNGRRQVFLRDTCINAPAGCAPETIYISVATDGTQGDDSSDLAAVSSNARFVTFSSVASNLVANDTNGWMDVFLRDTCIGAPAGCTPKTTLISAAPSGAPADGPSHGSLISADGRYVSYISATRNIVPNGSFVILHDTCFGAPADCTPTNRGILVGYAGNASKSGVAFPSLSASGRFAGFDAAGPDLVPGEPGQPGQMVGGFFYDSCVGAPAGCIPRMMKASLTYNGGQPDSGSGEPAPSSDGSYVLFMSVGSNLLSYPYISSSLYVRKTCLAAPGDCIPTTYVLSVDSSTGVHGNSLYTGYPAITPDGRYAVFLSSVANWPGSLHSNGLVQVWLARVH